MIYRLLADLVLLVHLLFVAFVLLGGLLLLRWPRLWRVHLPALAWGLVVQWADWVCPLTPLENALRHLGGQAGYHGGMVEHLVSALLYPDGLTPPLRVMLGMILLIVNCAVYVAVILRAKAARRGVG